ncbi:SDR family NAD(P)-dependent oxidoreductase, partial [Chloroflexota bacterium]
MVDRILITGGAGFIGSHLAEGLLHAGYKVRIVDNLSPQVHGPNAHLPEYLEGKVEFIQGDILDRDSVEKAMYGTDAVIHLAAETGVGQSMYEIARYTDVNINGSAILLEAVIDKAST